MTATPTPTPAPRSEPPEPNPVEGRSVGELALEKIDAFADLPVDIQRSLGSSAKLVELQLEEEVSVQGLAVLVSGGAAVCAAIADDVAAQIREKVLVSAFASIGDATKIRIVATEPTRVATWERATVEEALKSCPWVLDELVTVGERYAARAGATMGPLGDLDDFSRITALDRLSLKTLHGADLLAPVGSELSGLRIVGAGTIVLERPTGAVIYSAGDIVMPETVLNGGVTDAPLRAGEQGALVLFASRTVTLELFSILPSLVELLR